MTLGAVICNHCHALHQTTCFCSPLWRSHLLFAPPLLLLHKGTESIIPLAAELDSHGEAVIPSPELECPHPVNVVKAVNASK